MFSKEQPNFFEEKSESLSSQNKFSKKKSSDFQKMIEKVVRKELKN